MFSPQAQASQRRCPTDGDTLRSICTGPFGYSSTVVTDPSQAIASAISGAMASSLSGPAVVTWMVPIRLPSSASARPRSASG